MPTILTLDGFRFFFYSNEGTEPPHIHVEKGEGTSKYWLIPVKEAYSYNFSPRQKRKIYKIVNKRQGYFKQKWYEYFGN